ncbi:MULTISPECIES: hypothetical protein [Streptacidiphilus]|uniref:Uncharacterized protein n=1 Tax=Streptacidiphilus cavernicola TaxID=3342716 RepID=A0ABV6UWL2_9ACTN|nr:hypothetical protein [Streptacidiphilus jeojiense]
MFATIRTLTARAARRRSQRLADAIRWTVVLDFTDGHGLYGPVVRHETACSSLAALTQAYQHTGEEYQAHIPELRGLEGDDLFDEAFERLCHIAIFQGWQEPVEIAY